MYVRICIRFHDPAKQTRVAAHIMELKRFWEGVPGPLERVMCEVCIQRVNPEDANVMFCPMCDMHWHTTCSEQMVDDMMSQAMTNGSIDHVADNIS